MDTLGCPLFMHQQAQMGAASCERVVSESSPLETSLT